MALCEKLLIAGFSGSGKTSLVRALKAEAPLDWDRFDDLDQLVLKNHGRGFASLADLIADKGWEAFRLWERQELESWFKNEGKGVIALGGGALSPMLLDLYGKSRKIKFLYLATSFETCWSRLLNETKEIRPLAQEGKLQLHALFLTREPIFSLIEWELSGEESLFENAQKIWKTLT